MQHIGLFGYSRQVGKHALPRAIGFTAAGYSLGIPPEFFGLAAALDEAKRQGLLEIVHEFYPGIKTAIRKAGRYVAKTSTLSNKERNTIEKFISQSLGPQTRSEKEHELLVSRIISEFRKGNNPHDLIEKAAILRKSIG